MGLRKRQTTSRLRRWTKRVFVTLLTLAVLVVAGAFAILENLEKPVVKTRLQALIHDKAGLDVDYRTASMELRHGLHLTDVVVRSPDEMRAITPDLVRAKDVSVTWTGIANITHPERVVVSDAVLFVAVDENGKTSFDAIGEPTPSTPTSQLGKDIASVTSKLPTTDIDRTRVEVVRRVDGKLDRVAVSGIAVHAKPERSGLKTHLHASLGAAGAPIELAVVRTVDGAAAGDAHAKVWVDADASGADITATLELSAAKQSFASEVLADENATLHIEASAHFAPDAHLTRLRAERVVLGDGIADVSGDLDVLDEGAPRIHHAKGSIDFVLALALVPPGLLPVKAKAEKGTANFDVSDIALDKLPAINESAKLEVDANFEELDVAGIHAKSAKVAAHGTGAGETTIDLAVDKSHAHVDATRKGNAMDYTLEGDLPAFGPLRRYVPAVFAARTAKVTSKGHIDADAEDPTLEQHTEVRLEAPSFQPYGDASALALVVDAHGTTKKQDAKGTLTVRHLHIAGTDPGDDTVKFAVNVDKEAQKLDAKIDVSGQAEARVAAKLSVDRANAIHYDLDADISKLKPLAQYLVPGLDLAKLEVGIKGKGVLRGAVSAAHVDGDLDIRAQNVDFNSGTLAFSIPEATIDSVIAPDGDKRRITTKIHVAKGKIANETNAFEVKELHDEVIAGVTGPLDEPEISSVHKTSIEEFKQTLLPNYIVGDAKVELTARRSKDGVIHIADLQFANPQGGTTASLTGAIDPNEPQRLSLQGDVKQDLSKLSSAPDVFHARGTAAVALRIESPDLQIFRTNADLKFENTDIHIPHQNIHIEGANGQVPIVASIRATKSGPKLIRESDNPYAALRFADQHPLLNRTSFLSVRKATLPHDVVISNLVGNFQVVHNIFTLRQFELGFRGGKVSGQAALDWNDDKSVVDLRVRADHVQSSRGEPFTGSASVIVSAADHNIEGRADVLQIGERHLLDILELEDPYHNDPQINSVRRALKFGYPDKIRIGFKRGFASAHIELGGLARFFSVDDLKGLPIGPVIDRYLGPLFPVKVETKVGQK